MTLPERTCIGCRRRDVKPELLRLVRKAAFIAVDPRQREPGRGAYLHPKPECVELAVRRRTIGRALKANVDSGQLGELMKPYVTRGLQAT